MIDALTMTEAAMLNDVRRLHVASHNLANSGTVAFKREIALLRPRFEATLRSSALPGAAAPLATTTTDHRGGALRLTSRPLDVAIEGDGFFVLSGTEGPLYTRLGSFELDPAARLVGAGGLAVMGDGGEIVLSSQSPRIDRQGNVWDGQSLVAKLRVVQFRSPGHAEAVGNGIFSAAEAEILPGASARVRQGFVESANVIAMHEMVKLIETMRHFETSQRFLKGYDAMTGIALSTLGSL